MIPTTWDALLLVAVSVLPGAMFRFGFERQVGAYGVTLADRVLRFVAASLVLDLLYAWPAYGAFRTAFAGRSFGGGQYAVAWAGLAGGLVAPAVLGSVLGGLYATRKARDRYPFLRRLLSPAVEARLLAVAFGPEPAPRAWDDLFSERPNAYLRVRCLDGRWVGGAFGTASSAGTFPYEADLLLEEAWPVDDNGVFGIKPLGYALYIPAKTIAYVEVVPRTAVTEGGDGD
jgi:hypothetical protein